MKFRWISAIWYPGKVSAIILVMLALVRTSVGYVGTSDSTLFLFGQNEPAENGALSDRILDVDVSLLRSASCGDYPRVFAYVNNTLISMQGGSLAPRMFTDFDPEISSVSSSRDVVRYSLAANGSMYGYGFNDGRILLNDPSPIISQPTLSPPRLNEDIRYCFSQKCLAFSHFPPGSTTNESVIHEPNIPLYKFIGGWGDLSKGHLGMNSPPVLPTSGMYYEGPDLIVKKVRISDYFSIFILHNNTVLVSGGGVSFNAIPIPSATNGPTNLYRPIVYNSSIDDSSELKIVDASAAYHALLLSEDHRVFFFGSNDGYPSGILGLVSPSTLKSLVSEVPFKGILYQNDYIVQIRAVSHRSSVITNMGFVYIWGTRLGSNPLIQQLTPTIENTFLKDRYAVRYLEQDDITKTTHGAVSACVLSRPRAGNCTGMPPSADYYCIGGLWTTRGGSNLETLTISSPTEIDGNITISGPLVINPQSSISVTQCLSVGSIEIVKQQGDDTSSQDIISTGKHCPDISATTVSLVSTGDAKKCETKKATLSKSEMGGNIVYSAIFHVNDNGCKHNYWWIILVSVLGGVVVIVIIAILLVTFVKPIRAKVRPFWLRKHS